MDYVPRGIGADLIQSVINNVYQYKAFQDVPIVDIVIRYGKWREIVVERERKRGQL